MVARSARWRIELHDRNGKEEGGLEPDEGRQGLGWHPHVRLVKVADAW
jgi:SRSO17 transposase